MDDDYKLEFARKMTSHPILMSEYAKANSVGIMSWGYERLSEDALREVDREVQVRRVQIDLGLIKIIERQ